MSSPFTNYDQWLVAPYEQMQEESERFMGWCEAYDWDPGDPGAEHAYYDWLEGEYEAQAEAEYESYIDRKINEAQEREWHERGW